MATITIIRGDTCQKNITITGIDLSLIDSVYLSSDELQICKQLTFNSETNKYVFRLEPSETAVLRKITSDFDITIKFVGDDISTVVYRDTIRVLPKINAVGCLNDE